MIVQHRYGRKLRVITHSYLNVTIEFLKSFDYTLSRFGMYFFYSLPYLSMERVVDLLGEIVRLSHIYLRWRHSLSVIYTKQFTTVYLKSSLYSIHTVQCHTNFPYHPNFPWRYQLLSLHAMTLFSMEVDRGSLAEVT